MGDGPVDPRRRVPRTDTLLADPRSGRRQRDARPGPGQGDRLPRAGAAPAVASSTPMRYATPRSPRCPRRAPRVVLNATGVVLHTNLGRAPLSSAAVAAVVAAAGHTDVELDLSTGRRARRGRGALDALAAAVPDAGAVHVVNNGAAALVLAATALAAGREIVVSRGELVEIGDGFRLPDLLESTGARLREVGTTNRTTLADYAAALGPQTGFVLKVHPSNFRVTGFTSATPGHGNWPPSACRWSPTSAPVCSPRTRCCPTNRTRPAPCAPVPRSSPPAATSCSAARRRGCCSATSQLVDRLRRHPLARALRVDKLTLAALAATLHQPDTPTRAALHADPGVLRSRVERLRDRLGADGRKAEVVPAAAVVGGGGAPGVELDSWALSLPERYAEPLRTGDQPVLGRVVRGRLLLDLRCVPEEADETVRAAVLRVPGDD